MSSTGYVKYVAQLARLCHSVTLLVLAVKGTQVHDVDAIIRYNKELISKLQDLQRALIFFKNAGYPKKPVPPTPPDAA